MDRAGLLPDRCVVCNAEAGGYRLSRKLYWSPLAWRIGAVATPFLVMGLGIVIESPIADVLLLALVLMFIGAQRVTLGRLDTGHAWLARTGKAFRAALPELPK